MQWINRFEEVFIAMSMLAASMLILLNVILRVFGMGLSWSEELVRYFMIWITFLGSSVCIRQGSHISIDFILQILKKEKTKKILTFLIYLISLVFTIFFTYYSFQFFSYSFNSAQKTPALQIPIYIIFLVLPISGLLMFLRYFQLIVQLIQNRNHEKIV